MSFIEYRDAIRSVYGGDTLFSDGWKRKIQVDTSSIMNNKILKRREIFLFTLQKLQKKGKYIPLYVEFFYYPDLVDTAVCEKIIRSAKVHSFNKEYSCNVHFAENLIQHGEKISSLREKIFQENITLIKDVELKSKENLDLFEKRGKFLFLADCYMDNDYKGSFYINENCDVEWNGELAEKEDVLDLLNESKSDQKKSLLEKCPDLR